MQISYTSMIGILTCKHIYNVYTGCNRPDSNGLMITFTTYLHLISLEISLVITIVCDRRCKNWIKTINMTWIVTYDYIHNNITYSIITINTASDVRLIGASFWQTIVYPCKHSKWKGWWTSIKDAHKHKTANNTKQSVKKDMTNIGSKKRIYCTDKILIVKK